MHALGQSSNVHWLFLLACVRSGWGQPRVIRCCRAIRVANCKMHTKYANPIGLQQILSNAIHVVSNVFHTCIFFYNSPIIKPGFSLLLDSNPILKYLATCIWHHHFELAVQIHAMTINFCNIYNFTRSIILIIRACSMISSILIFSWVTFAQPCLIAVMMRLSSHGLFWNLPTIFNRR